MHRAVSLLLLALPVFGQAAFSWKDLGGGRVELREGGKPALVYNYGPQWKQGAPEDRRRCCYIFPVYTPAGVSMLEDFPQDHWHHRGLFWSWPVVETGGKKYDLWMTFTAKHRSEKAPVTSGGTLRTENFWVADGKDIVKENLRLTVMPAKDNAREMDVELTWEAVGAPVTLRGSAEAGKSYGGLSARFAAREGTAVRADGEVRSRRMKTGLRGGGRNWKGFTAGSARCCGSLRIRRIWVRRISGVCGRMDSWGLRSRGARRRWTGTLWRPGSRLR